MAETDVLQLLVAQPQVLAAILAIAYNIAGYVINDLQAKKLEAYQVTKLAETLVLFEALFTILQTVAGVSATWTAIITIVVAVVRSLIEQLKKVNLAVQAKVSG